MQLGIILLCFDLLAIIIAETPSVSTKASLRSIRGALSHESIDEPTEVSEYMYRKNNSEIYNIIVIGSLQRRSDERVAIKTFLSCDHCKMLSLCVASMYGILQCLRGPPLGILLCFIADKLFVIL